MPIRQRTIVAPGWEARLRERGLDTVAGVYALRSGQPVTRSGSTEVRQLTLGAGRASRLVFLKKYWANDFAQVWKGALRGTLFGRSKARREFENLQRLKHWGLDVPAPVAYGEERRHGWLWRSFLISEGVPNALPLDVFIREVLPQTPRPEAKQRRSELLEQLAHTVRRLHAHRFAHHDLFWRNIILHGDSLRHFNLLDAHKGRRWRVGPGHRPRAKDLAALDAPAPDFFRYSERLRFFLHYCDQKRLTRQSKRWLRQILALAEPMRRREQHRVREGRMVRESAEA